MHLRAIASETAPQAAGGYAQALEVQGASRLLFISGQIPETRSGEVPEGFDEQADVVFIIADPAQAYAGSSRLAEDRCCRPGGLGGATTVSRSSMPVNTKRHEGDLPLPLSFRPATPDDIPECVILRGRTRQNAISVERLAAMGITVESWADDVRLGSLPGYVCIDEEAIVGYCFGDKASGEVVVLALLPDYEARGIGRHLLGLVVRHLSEAGHKRLFLGCASDPAMRSHGFYRHLGWVSTGTFDRAGDEVLELFPPAKSEA